MTVSLQPTVFILFGATGDLVAKKIAPALYSLSRKGFLPKDFRVVGYGRRELTNEAFRAHLREAIVTFIPAGNTESLDAFLSLFQYVRGQFSEDADYTKLSASLKAAGIADWSRLFYLAVPPDLYEPILTRIASSGLAEVSSDAWTRLLVEKPLGTNEATAEALNILLAKLYREDQIYRIEHYLAKHMVQNVLAFRFSNSLFESNWDAEHIESIHIKLWEEIGVERRGAFYDAIGTLRDVGQNHLLQMLALTTMEEPTEFSAEGIRAARAELLKSITPFSPEDVQEKTFRAQYQGYRDIEGVAADSQTETYFKIKTTISNSRWKDVPIILESGKRMPHAQKEVVITFKPTKLPFPSVEGNIAHKNRLTFSLAPHEAITLEFFAKKPQHHFQVEKRSLDFTLREGSSSQYIEEYEKVVLEGLRGDQTLFVSTDELKAMWKVIDPIMAGWEQQSVPLLQYAPNTDAASVASASLDEA